MKWFLASLFVLLPCLPSQAQQNKMRIFYSQKVPAVVRRQVPRGGETKFFGVWKSEKTKSAILIHFYTAPTREEPLSCKVDIFEQIYMGKSSKIERINSIRLDGNSPLFEYVTNNVPNTVVTLTYGADVVWVNQKEKQQPLLRFNIVTSGGLHGQSTDYMLINFPLGWDKESNVQYYHSGRNTIDVDSVSFNKVDEDGFMIVTVIHSENGAMPDSATVSNFYWNGKFFSEEISKK